MAMPASPESQRAARRRRALLLFLSALLLVQLGIGIAAIVSLSHLPWAGDSRVSSRSFLRDLPALRQAGGFPGDATPAGAAAEGAERAASPARIWLLYGPLLAPSLLLLLVGALVGLLKPLDARAWAVALAFLSLAQGVSLFLEQTPLLGILPLPLLAVLLALARLALYPLAHFSLVMLSSFPSESWLGRALRPWRWLVTLPFALLALDGLLDSLVIGGAGTRPLGTFGALLERFAHWELLIALLVALCLALLAAQRRSASASEERRRGIIEAGILAACAGALWAVLGWKTGWHQGLAAAPGGPAPLWVLSWLAPVFLFSFLPASFTYAVLARRVFGIRLIIRRGLQHLLLSRSVLVVEGILIFLILESLLRLEAGRAEGASGAAIITLAAIVGIGRINRPLFRRLDRRFFRERYDARRLLLGLGQRFGILSQKSLILAEAVQVIGQALQLEGAACLSRDLRAGQPRWHVLVRFPAETDGVSALDGDEPPVSALEALSCERPLLDLPATGAREGAAAGHPRAELLVAIPGAEGVVGCLALAAKRSGEPFGREDRTLLTTVAGQLGLTLENLALLETARREARQVRELEIAQQVQRQLFPARLPELSGWRLAALCKPAQEVGGDYYDVFLTEGRQLALALGDVSGKGLGPALVMSNIQALIRDRMRRADIELPALAQTLNQHLREFTGPSTFITLFVGLLDPDTGRLRYVNCGHNPPLLLAPGAAEPLRLEAGGTVLGLLPALAFAAAEARLAPGSTLLLYSDGVTEAAGPGESQFGETRLMQGLGSGLQPEAMLAELMTAIQDFAGGQPQSDDISVVCLKRL